MINAFANIIGTLLLIGIITALTLPGRQTAKIIAATLSGFSTWTRVAISGK